MIQYEINDKVVFRTQGTNQIGVITNRRKSEGKVYYDLRSEKGGGFLLVSIDKAKNKASENYAVIDSKLTAVWNASVESKDVTPTKLFAKDGVGHSRANYAENVELNFDGENTTPNTMVQQIEKENDFVFPLQGPRSF